MVCVCSSDPFNPEVSIFWIEHFPDLQPTYSYCGITDRVNCANKPHQATTWTLLDLWKILLLKFIGQFSVLKHEKAELAKVKGNLLAVGCCRKHEEWIMGNMERSNLMVGCRDKLLELARDFILVGLFFFFSFIFNFYPLFWEGA